MVCWGSVENIKGVLATTLERVCCFFWISQHTFSTHLFNTPNLCWVLRTSVENIKCLLDTKSKVSWKGVLGFRDFSTHRFNTPVQHTIKRCVEKVYWQPLLKGLLEGCVEYMCLKSLLCVYIEEMCWELLLKGCVEYMCWRYINTPVQHTLSTEVFNTLFQDTFTIPYFNNLFQDSMTIHLFNTHFQNMFSRHTFNTQV